MARRSLEAIKEEEEEDRRDRMTTMMPPLVVGDQPTDQWTMQTTSGGTAPIDGLSGTNFSLVMHNTIKATGDMIGAGTFSIINTAQGIIQYAWDSTDTATAGTFQ